MRARAIAAGCCIWVLALASHPQVIGGQSREIRPGDPLPGLTPREAEEFRMGQEDFTVV